jgi:uncharacterized membrane protein
MLTQLKQSGRYNITLLLITMSIFSFGISIARIFLTDTKTYLFLNWNLFLAFIPWALSTYAVVYKTNNKLFLAVLILSWLLFFPNSPYILTDLFHLRKINSAPIWFDLVVILSFAWTGLLYGFISLLDIEEILSYYFNKRYLSMMTISLLFLGAFGIYLGRYLRWNSWDIIQNPHGLYADISDRFINPINHLRTWGMTILMGILLNFMYFSIKFMKGEKS